MKVMVVGGTGTVGTEVVRQLQARGVEVGLLARDEAKAKALHPKATIHKGDTLEQTTVRSVFKGYDGAFMLNRATQTETHEGLMTLNGARVCGVKRFVYMSVQDADKAQHLPHFGSKVPIENALKVSGMEWTILRPNNFHQNEFWFKDAILQYDLYPQPIGSIGISRVDIRDIAEAAAIALTKGNLNGQMIDLVGPDVCTGPWTAEVWSRLLGKKVNYISEDMDAWEQMFRQWMPDWLVWDYRMMYEYFQTHQFNARPGDVEKLEKILGHPLRRFEDYAREMAKEWTK